MQLKTKLFIEKKGINNGIKLIIPAKFSSLHYNVERNSSWAYIFGGSSYIFLSLLYKLFKVKKSCQFNSNYDVLFYVPNIKYERFLEALIKSSKISYLIISEENFKNNIISVDSFYRFKNYYYPFILFNLIFKTFIFSIKTSQIKSFKNHYWHIVSLYRREIIVKTLLNNIRFKKYFSFHPNDGFHVIIQKFYKNCFQNTYAIRPTTTTFTPEHKFISTDNLFYKTEKEYKIYKNLHLKDVKNLSKGGLIANRIIEKRLELKTKDYLLFIDTCTNIDPKSPEIRRNAVVKIINYFSKKDLNVLYKFHPGLIKSERKKTERLINNLNYKKITILSEEIPWDKVNIAIGFESTLFYDCFIRNIPVLTLTQTFSLFQNKISEFSDPSILSIKNEDDFSLIDRILNDKLFLKYAQEKQKKWFSKEYNFPNGMLHIIKELVN